MDRAGQGLDQDGPLVGQAVGDRVELGPVGDERGAPPAAGVGAVPDLQPRGDVPHGDAVARARWPEAQDGQGVEPPGRARQDGFDHHPGPGREVVEVVARAPDHLVPGNERHRDERPK